MIVQLTPASQPTIENFDIWKLITSIVNQSKPPDGQVVKVLTFV